MNLQTIPHASFPSFRGQLHRAVGRSFAGFGFSPEETERFLNANAAPFEDIHYLVKEGEATVAVAMRCGNLLEYVIPANWESRYQTVAEAIKLVALECSTLQIRIRENMPSHAAWYAGILPSIGFEMTPRMRMEVSALQLPEAAPVAEGYTIVPIRTEWIEACVAIHEAALPGSGENVRESLEVSDRLASWFIALCQGQPVGSGFGSQHRGRLFVEELAIDEAHRGRGLGKQLLLASVGSLTSSLREAKQVILDVDRENEAAVGLYRSLGFSSQDFYTVARLYH